MTTGTASAAALPILTSGQSTHRCTVIGSDGTTRAVVCIDLLNRGPISGGESGIISQTLLEPVCQNAASGADVRCANVFAGVGDFFPQTGTGEDTNQCGHGNFGLCGADCPTTLNGPNEGWAVAFSDTTIELPGSATFVSLGQNFGSGHFFLCP